MTLEEINKLPKDERIQALKAHKDNLIKEKSNKIHTSTPIKAAVVYDEQPKS